MNTENKTSLESYNKFNSLESLNFPTDRYCLALVNKAVELGLIGHDFETAFQASIIKLVHGEASSAGINILSESNTENILTGIVYTVDFFLLTQSSSLALESLVDSGLSECYSQGKKLIYKAVEELKNSAEHALEIINANPVYKNQYLHHDLQEITSKLKKLYVPFNPHEDYDISYPMPFTIKEHGISKTKAFLKAVNTELQILQCFDKGEINTLFSLYFKQNKTNPLHTPINLYTLVIHNAAFATLYGNRPLTLKVSRLESVLIAKEILLLNADQGKCEKFVQEMINSLCPTLPFDDGGYTEKYLINELVSRIKSKSAASQLYTKKFKNGEIDQNEAAGIIGTFGDMFLV